MVKISIDSKLKFRLIILSAIVSFIAVGVGMMFLSKIANTVKESKVKVAEINRDISLLDKIVEDRKQYGGDIKKVENSFPASYDEVSFFTEQLERLAQSGGITLQISIDKSKMEEKEQYASILYSFRISGGYTQTSEFLTQIAKLPYHTSVDVLKMGVESGSLVTNVKFRLFVEK